MGSSRRGRFAASLPLLSNRFRQTVASGWFWAVVVGMATAAPRASLLAAEFVNWDDDRFIAGNPLFQGPIIRYLVAAMTSLQFEAYQPLHLLSYLPDRLFWPHHPGGFHALNLALLSVNAGLLLILLERVLPRVPAVLACLLFSLHPLLTEPVAWISARKDLVALLFVLLLLLTEDRARDQREHRWTALILGAAAMLTKSAALVAPVFVFCWHRFVRERTVGFALRRAAPLGVVSALTAILVATLWQQAKLLGPRPLPLVLDVAGTLGSYAGRVVWPNRLSPLYPPQLDHQAVAGYLFLLGAGLVALFWRRLDMPARFAAVTFVGGLLPVSNLVPLYFRFGDRYQWFGLLGLVWPIGAWLGRAARLELKQQSLVFLAAGLVLVGEAAASARLAGAWKDSAALWSRAVAVQPRAFFAHLKLGETERRRKNWTAATAAYMRAIEREPDSVLGFGGLVVTLAEWGEATGSVPRGSAQAWLARLEGALADERALNQLAVETHTAGCSRCAQAIWWLGLRRFPRADSVLLESAQLALQYDQLAMALVYLREVRDQRSPDYQKLFTEAQQRLATAGKNAP